MLRSILLGGLAAALLTGPALADTMKPRPGSPAGFGSGFGLTSTNVGTATNTAAGIGNLAQQRAAMTQAGPGGAPGRAGPTFGPLVSTNVGVATNTAAGIGNSAQQRTLTGPGNGVQVGLNMTGRGPLVSTNVDFATNLAAGIGNSAGQKAIGLRK